MAAITVRIPEEKLKEIDELAGSLDRSRTWVVTDALTRYLEVERAWRERVEAGQSSIAQGKGIPHKKAMARIRTKITKARKKAPK